MTGTGDVLNVAGQSLSGNFGFAEDANGKSLDLTMSNASLSMGSALMVTNASAGVNVASNGISGSITGSISSSLAGFSATSLGVTFAPGSLEVMATGASLSVGGQSISGDFDFTDGSSGFQTDKHQSGGQLWRRAGHASTTDRAYSAFQQRRRDQRQLCAACIAAGQW